MINNKVIYLKSLVKNFKSKQEGLPKEIIKELKGLGIDLIKPKVKLKEEDDFTAGRDFILNHTEEFLQYAVDYILCWKNYLCSALQHLCSTMLVALLL